MSENDYGSAWSPGLGQTVKLWRVDEIADTSQWMTVCERLPLAQRVGKAWRLGVRRQHLSMRRHHKRDKCVRLCIWGEMNFQVCLQTQPLGFVT